ncbi:MAG: alanine--tRNA ligase [bacterium]
MNSSEIRRSFLDFFSSKQHKIVPSAPMVIKDDPTLMFTNAGMNQFKDMFLGNVPVKHHRVADTQKCLRVSGKHNDLEEVGHDTYHHTMFEMLGNWSFGDYFKKEAIEWAWELFTTIYKIPKEDLYASVFQGDESDGLPPDEESYQYWKAHLPEEQILWGSKKDNFWEMGDTGPCGPCSEIHVDIRTAEEKRKVPGKELVNMDHPEVIEVWNLVFIEFNRLKDNSLKQLSARHVDTGMGFERLAMVLQNVRSNYDTDIFTPIISKIAGMAGVAYKKDKDKDIAMRVIADHLRAVSFSIADGQLPSNTGAGYVIRRILRRALRYGFTFLSFEEPVIYKLVPVLVKQMGDAFPELVSQQELIENAIREEETAFLRTLSQGIKRFDQYLQAHPDKKEIDGHFAFELFDTFGFPIDLTQLMAREKGYTVDMEGYQKGLAEQKERSREAAAVEAGDWIVLDDETKSEFVGYDYLEAEARILKYRKVISKKKTVFEIILDQTPFYAESGGQVGDRGVIQSEIQTLQVIDTKKENNIHVHILAEEPADPSALYHARVDSALRLRTVNNHSATHLMHAALRRVLGTHVEQRGSLVDPDRLRFDFSHFGKMTDEEIRKVEDIVNQKIRDNIPRDTKMEVPMAEALEMGAMALFGEKYGERVRVITFDPDYSVELCGGTHVEATGQIGLFKITGESAIAAGVRRVEAVTGKLAEEFVNEQLTELNGIREQYKNNKNVLQAVIHTLEENKRLEKILEKLRKEKALQISDTLFQQADRVGDIQFIAQEVDLDINQAKDLSYKLRQMGEQVFVILGLESNGKVNLVVSLSDELVKKGYHAGNIIREAAKKIQGGGGGQPHMATAGGKDIKGLSDAFDTAREMLKA